MDYRRNLPFYMGYPQYQNWNQIDEDMLLEDLEYLQQMYPMYAKRYQVIINDYLDKMDYDGSLIYDQYPDRWQLERMVRSILNTISLDQSMPSINNNGPIMSPMYEMNNNSSVPTPVSEMNSNGSIMSPMPEMNNNSSIPAPVSEMNTERNSYMNQNMNSVQGMNQSMNMTPIPNSNPNMSLNAPVLPWVKELVTVLLYYEILKRRRKRHNYRYF